MKNFSWNSATESNGCCGYENPGHVQAVFLIGLIGVIIMLLGCTEPSSPPAPAPVDHIGSASIYVFAPDSQDYLAAPQPFPLDAAMSPAEALTALGDHLCTTYFRGDNRRDTAIRFEVAGVHRFPVAQRDYRLAVINMIDPQLEALQNFFQGSSGGLTTFYMLTATFLQPQRDPPLADGLILLYNGEEFPEIDHVNFRGIATPETIRPLVTKVLYRYRPDSRDATG